MELKQIKELMAAMGRTGTKKIMLKKEGFELHLERGDSGMSAHAHEAIPDFHDEVSYKTELANRTNIALSRGRELTAALNGTAMASNANNAPAASGLEKNTENTHLYVTSPMVGTFYSSPSPEDPPFVKVGDKIDQKTIVCIIEAMKVMNEVKAGFSGTIIEVLVESGHPVEFGTKLFKIA